MDIFKALQTQSYSQKGGSCLFALQFCHVCLLYYLLQHFFVLSWIIDVQKAM